MLCDNLEDKYVGKSMTKRADRWDRKDESYQVDLVGERMSESHLMKTPCSPTDLT